MFSYLVNHRVKQTEKTASEHKRQMLLVTHFAPSYNTAP